MLAVTKSSLLYSSSSNIIFMIELKDLQFVFLVTHFLLCYLMKSECECSLDSQMQSALYSKLNLPIEHRQSKVRPKEQRSSLQGSKYLSLGCLIFLKNSGELYQTVVSSAEGFYLQLVSIISSKSQRRQVPLWQSIFQGLISRCARPSFCSFQKTDIICIMKLLIYSFLKCQFFLRLKPTYSCKFISYFSMNKSNETCYFSLNPSFFRRCPSLQPVLERQKLTPKSGVILLCFILSILLSICTSWSLQGTSLITQLIFVSLWLQIPTMYLLRLSSWMYSNSTRSQKSKGRKASHTPSYITQ